MDPPCLINFPVELQTLILKSLLDISRGITASQPTLQEHWDAGRSIYYGSDAPVSSPRKARLEQDLHATLLFPQNVAAVCQLWRQIVVGIPEYWTRVVFDVAKDPTPFLNAFSWSIDLEKIEVFVFNSTSNAQDVDKDVENARVATIVHALKAHIHRCRFIIFHLTYSSSLPSPFNFLANEAPHLEDLTLDCRINDIELRGETLDLRGAKVQGLPTSFPMLRTLSLTGFWFIYMAYRSPSPWLESLKFAQHMSIKISQITLPKAGYFCLSNLLDRLTEMEAFTSIYFTDISLDYLHDDSSPAPTLGNFVYSLITNIHFDRVSRKFIEEFHANTILEVNDHLSFKDCEVPYFTFGLGGDLLMLENIIDSDDGQNLRNVVGSWGGTELIIRSCSSFNDRFLSWLAGDVESPTHQTTDDSKDLTMLPAAGLMNLLISDCPNFSPRALQRLVEVRKGNNEFEGGLIWLTVNDSRDVLSEEDKQWFKENSGNMCIRWNAQHADGSETSYFWGAGCG
ncbi:hypothetical protein GALMADRAFT_238651 [Galerina marginata CBS 339.88]|uniref:F-box domain-containing protein n=1 Tax=Galerina marginata (strain CBS 339.88) TaxID=685588 RepID=A0A067TVG1_GALM3|nr:hypothetical protein GALMADRAFT_238651 [Galerina marginata CBS 339.88]